jgi:hypothetical protein
MAAVEFTNMADLKKQPTEKRIGSIGGFPQPVQAQMKQLVKRPKVKFPNPSKRSK